MEELIFRDKKIMILGLGIEGLALLQFLSEKEAVLTVYDRQGLEEIRSNFPAHPGVQILEKAEIKKNLSQNDVPDLSDYDMIFRSPSIYFDHPKIRAAKAAGTFVSTQIDLFMRLCPCKVIGVTGTKGKGTTASLIYEILKKNQKSKIPPLRQGSEGQESQNAEVYLAGNIGYPAITLLSQIKPEDIVILELSNFQLADVTKGPDIAVVTNIAVDHLDYHKTAEEYQNAKFNILRLQTEEDLAVINLDSKFDQNKMEIVRSRIIYFSGQNSDVDACVRNGDDGLCEAVLDPKNRNLTICREGETKIVGRHNFENICAAAIVCDRLGVSLETIAESVKQFNGLPHRLEVVGKISGVTFINDSFATNPGPTMAAVSSFKENKILILGGSSKGADFSEMAKLISLSNVTGVVLIGVEGEKINQALIENGYKGVISPVLFDLKEAVLAAQRQSKVGDIVIFSPACASFDMFKNYKQRGEIFKQIISELAEVNNE